MLLYSILPETSAVIAMVSSMGTPALTTRGMQEAEMQQIATAFHQLLKATKPGPGKNQGELSRAIYEIDPEVLAKVQGWIQALLEQFPLYPELMLDAALAPALT